MLIFIRNIPADYASSDVRSFIESALKPGYLQNSGYIDYCDVMVIYDRLQCSVEYHGLVKVDSKATGQRVIKLLNGAKIAGQSMEVREYLERQSPRVNHVDGKPENLITIVRGERRRAERVRINSYIGYEYIEIEPICEMA